HRANVDADPHIPARCQSLRRDDHLQATAHAAQDRILDAPQEPGSGHEGIPDGLDFLDAMALRNSLPRFHELLEVANDFFRLMLIAKGRETHNIRKEDRYILEAPWPDDVGCLELVDDGVRQDDVQQGVGPLLLLLDLP